MIEVKHHAILMGCLFRAAMSLGGTEGPSAVRRAVQVYGEQRGYRMAQIAQQKHQPADWITFIALVDWDFAETHPGLRVEAQENRTAFRTPNCPWHHAWSQADMLVYGRFYCRYFPTALVRGFNPSLKLECPGQLTEGGHCCTFRCLGFRYSDVVGRRIAQLRDQLADSSYQTMEEHAGHFYAVCVKVFRDKLGSEITERICRTALDDMDTLCEPGIAEQIRMASLQGLDRNMPNLSALTPQEPLPEEYYNQGFPRGHFAR